MGKWDDRVQAHPVNGAFNAAAEALRSLNEERVAQAPEDVDRLLYVVDHVRARLQGTSGVVVPQATLDGLNQQLTQLTNELNNYAANGQLSHLGNANTYADAMVDLARVLCPLPADEVEEEVARDAERVRGLVSTTVERSQAQLTQLQQAAEAVQQQLASAREGFTAQASASQQQVAQVEARVQEQVNRLEQAIASHESRYAQEQTERSSTFDEAERRRAEVAEAAAKKAQEAFSSASTELKQQAAGTLEKLAELKREADELVGAIGVAGVAAGYNETAKKERRIADKWRYATVTVALLAAGVLITALFIDHAAAGSWQRLVTRLVVSGSFAGLAAYCGRQSAEHRSVERDARARHLQLAALNPYLANLPKDDSDKLKLELAPGYFTPPSAANGETESDGTAPVPIAQLVDLVKAVSSKGAAG